MSRSLRVNLWLLLFAVAAYAANGAQAHVQLRHADGVLVQMCGLGGHRTIELQIGDPAPSDTSSETCCGDCSPTSYDATAATADQLISIDWSRAAAALDRSVSTPVRSPLWPGAPPHGPPAPLKA